MIRITIFAFSSAVSIMNFALAVAQNVTAVDTWPGYDQLPPCEGQCYKGFVATINCSTPQCICSLDHWPTSLQTIYDCARTHCDVRLGTASHPDPNFSKMLAVLREYCSIMGFK